MLVRRSAALLAAGAALSGCATATPDERDQAGNTVMTFLATCARGQGTAAYAMLTGAARETFLARDSALAGCEELTAIDVPDSASEREAHDVFAEARIARLELHGDTATATLEAPGDAAAGLELETTGRRWHVAGPPPSVR